MKKLITGMMLTLVAVSVMAEEECQKQPSFYASMYYMEQINKDGKAGAVFEEKVKLVEKIGKNKAFESFQITSQDINIEQDTYMGGDNLTLSISFSLQFEGGFDTVSVLQKNAGARSLSVSKSQCGGCGC